MLKKRILSLVLATFLLLWVLCPSIPHASASTRWDVINRYNVTGEDIVAKAREFIGTGRDDSGDYRTRTGFTYPQKFDCSGLVYRVCREVGLSSSRPNYTMGVNDNDGKPLEGQDAYGNYYITAHTHEQRYYGEDLSAAVNAYKNTGDCSLFQPGDLLFFDYYGDNITDHVGIYTGANSIINSTSSRGTIETPLSQSGWPNGTLGASLFAACRLVDNQYLRPAKPHLQHNITGNIVTFSWNPTANTTHYDLSLDVKNSAGVWEKYDTYYYAESGMTETLPDGEYRALLMSYNSNDWEEDDSDWLHTNSDHVTFTISATQVVNYYWEPYGDLWFTDSVVIGQTYDLSLYYTSPPGRYFCGWSYTPNATTFDVRPGDTLTINGILDLYPVYVTHEQAISGETVYIYDINDVDLTGYTYEAVQGSVPTTVDNSHWSEWSRYFVSPITADSYTEVRTATLYRYYYYPCPNCGAHEPFSGTSDCGAQIPGSAWHQDWFTTPYSQSNPQTFSYTAKKYYTTTLGDGQLWCFSAGNLYDTAIGTIDSDGAAEVIVTGYSSRTWIPQLETVYRTVTGYRLTREIPEGIAINATNFPDATFRSYVSTHFDANSNGYLSAAERNAVTEIDVQDKGITTLAGIAHFPALTYLDCNRNHLTSLDVSQNPALKELYCSNNQLTSLDVSQNPALQYLNCYNNQLTCLDVSQNPALQYLNCYNNQLTCLDVSQNPALQNLSCFNNQLTSLDVSQNPALQYLNCYNNQLTSLDVSQNPALQYLNCYNNQLTSLDVSQNPALKELYCSNNQLTSLDVSQNPALYWLACSDNIYEITLPEDRTFDLSTLPGNFDVSKASNWVGGSVKGNILTVHSNTQPVTYTYNMGQGKTATFTLKTPPLFDLSGANLKLGEDITMFFYVDTANLDGTGYYMTITRQFNDGMTEDDVQTIPYSQWQAYSGTLKRVAYPNLAASQMNENISVVIYNNAGQPVSNQWTDSIRAYCERMINNGSTAAIDRQVMVDLLNYGAAAQDFFDYDTANPANANLTTAQQGLASSVPTLEDNSVKGTNYVGSSLSLRNKILLTVYFKNINPNMYAKVTYKDFYGQTQTLTVSGANFVKNGSYYGIRVDSLVMAEYQSVVSVQVFNSANQLVASGSDSVESYLCRMLDENALYPATAKALSSALAYANTKK